MTELQTILKETLTLWEAKTQQALDQPTLTLNGQAHRVLALEMRQKEIE